MTTDYRALCAELADIVTAHASPDDDAVGYVAAVLTRARAALAEPEPATDGEVAELVGWLLLNRDSFEKAYPHQLTYDRFTRVAELLSQLASRP